MRIKADLYSGRLFEYWEPKKRDHQTLPVISHRCMKINTATGVSTRHKVTTMMSGDIVTKTKSIRVGEYRAQTSETMIDLAAIRLMLNRIALHETFKHPLKTRRISIIESLAATVVQDFRCRWASAFSPGILCHSGRSSA